MTQTTLFQEEQPAIRPPKVTYYHTYKIIKVTAQPCQPTPLNSSRHIAEFISKIWDHSIGIYESFYVIFLNRRNIPVGHVCLSSGGITGTVVDVRLLLKYALDTLATGVVIAHNHPSGNVRPSPQDKDMTRKVKQALALCDIQVLDHCIINDSGDYYSFCDEGEM